MALGAIGLVVALTSGPTAVGATRTALINDSTVSGGYGSEEAQFATAQGYSVTIVSDADWATMTAADFGKYDVLIAGDPTCGSLPPGLVASAPVWGPVVLGTAGGRTKAGNRTIVGTDPVFHSGSISSNRAKIINDGIAYAGLQPGTTGMYLDTTCAANYYNQSAETLLLVQAISAGVGPWTLDADPPCGGSVSLIASNPAFADLTTADLQGWGCSVHESFPTFPSDWSALAVATDTATHPTCGVDPNTGASACGEAYILISGSAIVVVSGSISVSPTDATNPSGTDHTITATVTQGGSPLAGQLVSFTVTGQNAGAVGTCVPVTCMSDANGHVSFTYHDTNGPGDDTIKASFTDSNGSLQSATAQKHWVGSVEQPISAAGTSISASEGSPFSGTVATFTDPDTAATAAEYSATIDWGDASATTTGTISGSGGNFTVSGSHTYATAGTYTVTVTITDVDTPSNTATATSKATVSDPAITASGTSISSTEGSAFAGTVASFTDPNTAATAAEYSASIDWGDGSAATAGTISGSGGNFTVSGSHTYAEEGTYTVSVTITDVDNLANQATATTTATVGDAALSSACAAPPFSGKSFAGPTAGLTDANTLGSAADFTATISWGDASSSSGTVTGSGGAYSVSGTHTYASTGIYTITTSIADDGGSTTSATCTLIVFAGAPGGGSFVVGDKSATGAVTFWGAQWWKVNSLSGGSAPAAFKGFALKPATPSCGVNWSTDPGNSAPPPAGPLPAFMAVIVSSSISQSGSQISGNTRHIIIVKTNPGYEANPGHAGTGTYVATVC
jgi:PKD repeat protein